MVGRWGVGGVDNVGIDAGVDGVNADAVTGEGRDGSEIELAAGEAGESEARGASVLGESSVDDAGTDAGVDGVDVDAVVGGGGGTDGSEIELAAGEAEKTEAEGASVLEESSVDDAGVDGIDADAVMGDVDEGTDGSEIELAAGEAEETEAEGASVLEESSVDDAGVDGIDADAVMGDVDEGTDGSEIGLAAGEAEETEAEGASVLGKSSVDVAGMDGVDADAVMGGGVDGSEIELAAGEAEDATAVGEGSGDEGVLGVSGVNAAPDADGAEAEIREGGVTAGEVDAAVEVEEPGAEKEKKQRKRKRDTPPRSSAYTACTRIRINSNILLLLLLLGRSRNCTCTGLEKAVEADDSDWAVDADVDSEEPGSALRTHLPAARPILPLPASSSVGLVALVAAALFSSVVGLLRVVDDADGADKDSEDEDAPGERGLRRREESVRTWTRATKDGDEGERKKPRRAEPSGLAYGGNRAFRVDVFAAGAAALGLRFGLVGVLGNDALVDVLRDATLGVDLSDEIDGIRVGGFRDVVVAGGLVLVGVSRDDATLRDCDLSDEVDRIRLGVFGATATGIRDELLVVRSLEPGVLAVEAYGEAGGDSAGEDEDDALNWRERGEVGSLDVEDADSEETERGGKAMGVNVNVSFAFVDAEVVDVVLVRGDIEEVGVVDVDVNSAPDGRDAASDVEG
ncbi:hypothetical protein K438DRAFT_1984483 [Mycena galopus ATCC 62051]|nr:hypothetical protein K438DRAFT_1984483 [Mycena galopus ATCC 62051]